MPSQDIQDLDTQQRAILAGTQAKEEDEEEKEEKAIKRTRLKKTADAEAAEEVKASGAPSTTTLPVSTYPDLWGGEPRVDSHGVQISEGRGVELDARSKTAQAHLMALGELEEDEWAKNPAPQKPKYPRH